MKRKRLQGISARLGGLASVNKAFGSLVGVYYLHDGQWNDLRTAVQVTAVLEIDLQSAFQSRNGWYRRSSSVVAFFRHSEFNAVSQIEFSARPTAKTIAKLQRDLVREIDNAKNEFFANHDPLTECLNKGALERKLLGLSEAAVAASASFPSSGLAGALSPAKSVFLIAMDLDHFKSINDNFGHLYGDLVLRAFSWRVDACLDQWLAETASYGIEGCLARPGGEEFQIVVSGAPSADLVLRLAELIRSEVGSDSLPSIGEFSVLKVDGRSEVDKLPSEIERKVTVSLGVSSLEVKSGEKPKQSVARMLREADIALYSAKGGGRNIVRYFPEILKSHARVIEHVAETALVAVDVGSEVGVKLGQEFIVFPPSFTGGVPYYAGEGRSRRRIGTYPRYPIARVAVIDVQAEVSFCKIEQWLVESLSSIPVSSGLHAVPLGSISHLVSTPGGSHGKLSASVESLRNVVSKSAGGKLPTATFLLRDLDAFASARGLHQANQALASVFEILTESIAGKLHVAMVGENAFVVTTLNADVEVFKNNVISAKKKIILRLGDDVGVRVGVFDPNEYDGILPEHGIELSMLSAINYSQEDPVVFNESVAAQVINKAVSERRFDTARADVEKLFDIGLRTHEIVNQAGLLEYLSGNYELAEAYFSEANESGRSRVYGMNLAAIKTILENWQGAYELYQENFREGEYMDGYLGAYALVCVTLLEQGRGDIDRVAVAAMVEKAISLKAKGYVAADKGDVMGLEQRLKQLDNPRVVGQD